VVVEPWTGGNVQGQVIRVRPFELRLRGFRVKEGVENLSGLEKEANMILHDLFQEANEAERNEFLSRYILSLRQRGIRRGTALLRTREVASICSPPISDEHAKKLFREMWDAIEPKDPPVPRMKDLLYIAQKEIAELKDERARLRTALQEAIKLLDTRREE